MKEDKRTPEGLLECPKCNCTFRVCLGIFDGKCYVRMNPDHGKFREIEKQKNHGKPKDFVKVLHESMGENKEVLEALGTKKKRGRPKKVKENVPSE